MSKVKADAPVRPSVPPIPREAFTLPDGGEVFVRALRITERLQLRREVTACRPSNSDEALEFSIPRLLARTVVDSAMEPVFDLQQWCDYSATYPGTVLELFNKSSDVSGLSPASQATAEKNSEASRS